MSEELEKLKKENEELKKRLPNQNEMEMLSTLRMTRVNNVDELSSLLLDEPSSKKEKTDDEYEYEEDDDGEEEEEEDSDLRKRVAALEKQREQSRFAQNLERARQKVKSMILEKKKEFPYLAAKSTRTDTLDRIIRHADSIYSRTRREPDENEVFKLHNQAYKEEFISDAKELGMTADEFKNLIKGDIKKAEKAEEVKDKEETKEVPKDSFQIKSKEEIEKMNDNEQVKYYFDEAEAKDKNFKMIDPKAPKEEPKPDDKKEPEKEVSDEERSKQIALKTGGEKNKTSDIVKDDDDLNDDGISKKGMREAGFDV